MVDSLVGCLGIFFFCVVIVGLFLCVFAIFFVQAATTFLESSGDISPEVVESINLHFGSVGDGMLTLFKAASNDWITYYDEVIEHLGTMYKVLYVAFITFYMVALFNVIVGTFCEKAISLASPTTHELIHRRYEKEFADAKELMGLLIRVLDDDGSRVITAHDFAEFIADPEVQIYFEVRNLKPTSALKFFKTLCDSEETDKIDFATFVSNCVKLDGTCSSIDMHILTIRQMNLQDSLHRNFNTQNSEMLQMRAEVRSIASTLRGPRRTSEVVGQSNGH